jgi:hypothetical protein
LTFATLKKGAISLYLWIISTASGLPLDQPSYFPIGL